MEPIGPASPRLRELGSYVMSCILHSTSRVWCINTHHFFDNPYRVESFRKIISFILIRLRTVIRSVLMDFMAEFSLAASSFFFKFPIYRAARTYRPRHERGCAPVSLASNGTRSSSCEITGKEA